MLEVVVVMVVVVVTTLLNFLLRSLVKPSGCADCSQLLIFRTCAFCPTFLPGVDSGCELCR